MLAFCPSRSMDRMESNADKMPIDQAREMIRGGEPAQHQLPNRRATAPFDG